MKQYFSKIYLFILVIVGLGIIIPFIIDGYDYYSTSLKDRFFHIDHELLKPSGTVGHGLGIIGSLMMLIGVLTYMIRKRVRKFMRMGALKHWLSFHIFLCSVGPILILLHTSFKFGGIASISFWSMVMVVISGIIGRIIYIQIPRTIQGKEISIDELQKTNIRLTDSIKNDYNIPDNLLESINNLTSNRIYQNIKLSKIIPIIINDFFANKKILKYIKNDLYNSNIEISVYKNVISICKSKIILSRRIGLLTTMHKLFQYWHIAHLPFAIIMLVIMVLHVGITVLMGYSWIFNF